MAERVANPEMVKKNKEDIATLNSKINHAVTNVLTETNVTTAATYSSTGKTFTITKFGLVKANMSYGTGRPVAIGIKASESASSASVLLNAIDPSAIEDTSGISCSGLLSAGTYYVWCKTASAGKTNLTVDVVYFNN